MAVYRGIQWTGYFSHYRVLNGKGSLECPLPLFLNTPHRLHSPGALYQILFGGFPRYLFLSFLSNYSGSYHRCNTKMFFTRSNIPASKIMSGTRKKCTANYDTTVYLEHPPRLLFLYLRTVKVCTLNFQRGAKPHSPSKVIPTNAPPT